MKAILQQMVDSMSVAEKEELVSELKAAIADELAAGAAGEPAKCPRCGCPRFTRKGRSAGGAQRWLCAGCRRTFSAKTMGLLAQSKLPPATWMAFAECMADALSLRESASRCGVSLYTAWFMRMRVCEVMRRRAPAPRAGSYQVDGMAVRESLSGNHGRSGWFEMPRKAHRNGRDGRKGETSKSPRSICVVAGVNEWGDCFCRAACRGVPGQGDIGLVLLDEVPRGSAVATDGHKSYGMLAAWGWPHAAVDPADPSGGDINRVNSLHSRLRDFLRPFHGVATRRLQSYLDWFCWRERLRCEDGDRREILYAHETAGRYESTRRDLIWTPYLDWWWWAGQRSMVV